MPEETFRWLTGVTKRTFAEMTTVLEIAEAALNPDSAVERWLKGGSWWVG